MSIAAINTDIILFLMEISLQCDLAERAINRLEVARKTWLADSPKELRINNTPPIDIIENCHLLLLAAGITSKILFSVVNKERSNRLRKLMNIDNLPMLSERKIRNSYEHIDERLDSLSSKLVSNFSVMPLTVSDKDPSPDTIVLKRFCPRTIKIYYGNDSIDLIQLSDELKVVKTGVEAAYKALKMTKEELL